MTDKEIAELFANELVPARALAAALDRIDQVMRKPAEIDLRNRDIRFEWQGHRIGWSCWDENSYDGAPDSESNHIGYGPEKEDALADLMEKFALEPPLKGGKVTYMPRLVDGGGGSQPPEYKLEPYKDPDDVDFDDGLDHDDAR